MALVFCVCRFKSVAIAWCFVCADLGVWRLCGVLCVQIQECGDCMVFCVCRFRSVALACRCTCMYRCNILYYTLYCIRVPIVSTYKQISIRVLPQHTLLHVLLYTYTRRHNRHTYCIPVPIMSVCLTYFTTRFTVHLCLLRLYLCLLCRLCLLYTCAQCVYHNLLHVLLYTCAYCVYA